MESLGKKLVKLSKEDRKNLIELLNDNYEGDSMVAFFALGESEGSGDEVAYCYDCGAMGSTEDFCKVCRSVHLSRGEVIESIEVIALDNGDYADIRDSASMDDHDS
jgi:hypothetical protein